MDITTVFGTVVGGSNPSGGANRCVAVTISGRQAPVCVSAVDSNGAANVGERAGVDGGVSRHEPVTESL